jgi:hypothetical protein
MSRRWAVLGVARSAPQPALPQCWCGAQGIQHCESSGEDTLALRCLDAAAQVLAKADKPMNSQDLITAMAEQGLWKSPGGKTPHATLYAAMIREINEKGKEARFTKVDRGMFGANKASH